MLQKELQEVVELIDISHGINRPSSGLLLTEVNANLHKL